MARKVVALSEQPATVEGEKPIFEPTTVGEPVDDEEEEEAPDTVELLDKDVPTTADKVFYQLPPHQAPDPAAQARKLEKDQIKLLIGAKNLERLEAFGFTVAKAVQP